MNNKHKSLPSAFSLVGTNALPPIDNQGGIGSCASQAATRNQFSNAVTRYAHSIYSDCDKSYVYAPRFTFNFSGAGTSWVYDIIADHGCLPEADCMFEKNESGGSMREKDGKLCEKSAAWPVKKGEMKKALRNRIRHYEQIWVANEPYNAQLTTSELGRELLYKVKKAIVDGNAVVTGGYPGRWVYADVVNTGVYGKKGDRAVVAASGTSGGGHQVTVVGYDDDVTAEFGGVMLKGAFIIANSYGMGWMNNGCVYLMYDSVNTVSEMQELNDSKLYSGQMFLTYSGGFKMYSEYLAPCGQTLVFSPAGEKEIAGENYTVYNIKDKNSGKFIGYKNDAAERELLLCDESSSLTEFCLIPYGKLSSFAAYDEKQYKKEFEGTYWIYAVNRECGDEGFRIFDAGVGFSANGRSVNFATLNAGKYPVAKSWTLDCEENHEGFESRLGIAAGKDTVNERIWTLDQFCFTYWNKDIVIGLPELYCELEIETDNREGFYITLTRKGKDGKVEEYMPAMFRYGKSGVHPRYTKEGEYITFSGKVGGASEKGEFALSYSKLLEIPEGKSYRDYEWGFIITPVKNAHVTFNGGKLFWGGCEALISSADKKKAITKKSKFTF